MNFLKKWYTYQKERFPVVIFSTYIFCTVFAVFCYSNYYGKITYEEMLRTVVFIRTPDPYIVEYIKLIPMFIVAFLQFLMIRISDEFKDYEEDCKYRPYRPVPRGLVKLKELKILFVICAVLQIIITKIFNDSGLILLMIVWFFFWLLSKDFFIKKYIDKHILLGVFLDELLMPVLVVYLLSYVYLGIEVWQILLISYLVSWTVEIARKIRCKEDEEKGVKTYTAVFGINKAMLILFLLETFLMLLQLKIIGVAYVYVVIGIYMLVNLVNLLFVVKQTHKLAKITELSANIYIIIVYLSMGLLII